MNHFSIAFYNTENFFDPEDDSLTHDGDFTPNGRKKWTEKRYRNKVWKIGQAVSLLGLSETGNPPLFVGLAEIENAKVLQDLIQSDHLDEFNYDYIHFESLDERGIDTAMIYRKDLINPLVAEPIRLQFPETGIPSDFTRDILYVKFNLNELELHTFVLHLPSRQNVDVNRDFRNLIMRKLRARMDEILEEDPNAYIVIMGDMNGNPDDPDAVEILKTRDINQLEPGEMFNPMFGLRKSVGSLRYAGKWILFDQILFSKAFFEPLNGFVWNRTEVFKDRIIQEWDKRFSGSPFRTYAGNKYLGGYSDHFPVYAILNY